MSIIRSDDDEDGMNVTKHFYVCSNFVYVDMCSLQVRGHQDAAGTVHFPAIRELDEQLRTARSPAGTA